MRDLCSAVYSTVAGVGSLSAPTPALNWKTTGLYSIMT